MLHIGICLLSQYGVRYCRRFGAYLPLSDSLERLGGSLLSFMLWETVKLSAFRPLSNESKVSPVLPVMITKSFVNTNLRQNGRREALRAVFYQLNVGFHEPQTEGSSIQTEYTFKKERKADPFFFTQQIITQQQHRPHEPLKLLRVSQAVCARFGFALLRIILLPTTHHRISTWLNHTRGPSIAAGDLIKYI